MHSFLGVPVRVGEAIFGNLYLTEKRTGTPFTAADTEVAEALAAVAGLAIENARFAERADRRRRWGEAATEMATALLSGADPDEVLHEVATHVLALAGGDLAGVLAPSVDDSESLTVVAAVGHGADDLEGVRLPLNDTYLGATHAAGLPRLIDDISTMPVTANRAALTLELSTGYGPALLAPLGTGADRSMLATMREAGREPFDDDDLDQLAGYAGQVSIALQLARVQQREQRLQVQTDRDRIARDLHDHVVQRIFATSLSLDRLSRLLQPVHGEASARLARSVDELDETMAEIRSAIFELHEHDGGDSVNRRHQLADVVHRVTEGQALQCDVLFRGPIDRLPGELMPDLLAVVRELVTNVVRHAHARRVTVTASVGDEIVVVVADDGVGLPASTARSGLANLADRAERRGGRLTTAPRAPGTEVRWAVPRPVRQ
jgi:signal transduction histidine kinase